MKAYAYNNAATMTLDLTLSDRVAGRVRIAEPQPFIVRCLEEGENRLFGAPTFSWQFEIAESVFQALWDAGYRPAKGQAGAAEVNALKGHIAFAEDVAKRLLPKAKV